MLHNDDFNRREYVVKVLLKVLDNFTMEDAINCMQVSMQTCCLMSLRCTLMCDCCQLLSFQGSTGLNCVAGLDLGRVWTCGCE